MTKEYISNEISLENKQLVSDLHSGLSFFEDLSKVIDKRILFNNLKDVVRSCSELGINLDHLEID